MCNTKSVRERRKMMNEEKKEKKNDIEVLYIIGEIEEIASKKNKEVMSI